MDLVAQVYFFQIATLESDDHKTLDCCSELNPQRQVPLSLQNDLTVEFVQIWADLNYHSLMQQLLEKRV
jgi:hypothetical protein